MGKGRRLQTVVLSGVSILFGLGWVVYGVLGNLGVYLRKPPLWADLAVGVVILFWSVVVWVMVWDNVRKFKQELSKAVYFSDKAAEVLIFLLLLLGAVLISLCALSALFTAFFTVGVVR